MSTFNFNELLRDCPANLKFWSIFGVCQYLGLGADSDHVFETEAGVRFSVNSCGMLVVNDVLTAEPVVWPEQDKRSWDNFTCKTHMMYQMISEALEQETPESLQEFFENADDDGVTLEEYIRQTLSPADRVGLYYNDKNYRERLVQLVTLFDDVLDIAVKDESDANLFRRCGTCAHSEELDLPDCKLLQCKLCGTATQAFQHCFLHRDCYKAKDIKRIHKQD